ncbi:hypothetical protein ACPW96_17720 [Micromonospora sp. DT81.3]|uniref:hypothetical protein n=1 Tax=Micromonospora sp. DT81.3 TaxID=3416523 RepID=UPI003CF2CD96
MHPTSKPGGPTASRLIAPTDATPARIRRRHRVIAVCAFIGLLLGAAIILVVAFSISDTTAPARTITPPAADTVETTEPAVPEVQETTLPSGTAWLAMPQGEPAGIAILLPDATDDARALLDTRAAEELRGSGWAVATGVLGGESWGSTAASEGLSQLKAWAVETAGPVPALLAGVGMGATTGLTTLARYPDLGVTCFYAAAPLTDLAALVGENQAIGPRIADAWGREPGADDNPILLVESLPSGMTYRVVVPDGPPLLAEDANAFVSALEASGQTVSSVTAAVGDSPDADDLTAFAEGCSR